MRLLLLLALLPFPACDCRAQSTLLDLRARLLHKPLYFRIRTRDDNLRFDPAGSLVGTVRPITFTLDGVEITSVAIKSDRLLLTGQRVGLEFKHNIPMRIAIELPNDNGQGKHPETMRIEIAAPPSGDYSQVLDRIFTADLTDLTPTLPVYWQSFAKKHLLPPAASAQPSAADPSDTSLKQNASVVPVTASIPGSNSVGGSMKPPVLLSSKEPEFSPQARAARYSAHVLIGLVIDTAGAPTSLFIVAPAGLEMDERALAAVARYTFKPATLNGKAVPTEVNIDVNFQIF